MEVMSLQLPEPAKGKRSQGMATKRRGPAVPLAPPGGPKPPGAQNARRLQWPHRVKEAGLWRLNGWPGVPLAPGEMSQVHRYLEEGGRAVYKIIIMEKQASTSQIQVSAFWEYKSQDHAD